MIEKFSDCWRVTVHCGYDNIDKINDIDVWRKSQDSDSFDRSGV